ncbi:hypothetical protein N3K66_004024 [Trichothecium roseum]|uniref:Uncharacterized protein n=1 Tax=Trichothecium roseum TaxID=47278 RepID=A0ACC0V8W9_9HYPO|nr:hypothetical protein N3K66_004024 [Trichothecium roseum]
MMRKEPLDDEAEPPPSYEETVSPAAPSSSSYPSPSYSKSRYQSDAKSQTTSALALLLLPRHGHPPELVECVSAFLEAYLRRLRERDRTPGSVGAEEEEAVFLPGHLVREQGWALADPEQLARRSVEWVDASLPSKGKDGSSSFADYGSFSPKGRKNEFDGWGRWRDNDDDGSGPSGARSSAQWWSDEDGASRIAAEMRPTGEQEDLLRCFAGAGVREVVLRRENEMGLWERKTVYGIAVRMSDNARAARPRKK